jgi:rhodanese-related sulfurtransferase
MTDLWFDDIQRGLNDEHFALIDVRETHEFAAGHIPGSISMPLSTFDPSALEALSDKRIVFSCAAGVRSMHALHAARAAGFDLHEHYAGGFKDWVMSGGAVERG